MNAIRVTTRLDSDKLHIPELAPLIGKNVEIIVQEEPGGLVRGTGDWDAAARAAQELRETGYDFEAWREVRQTEKHSLLGRRLNE